ncbi:MAG: leucyl/phenylalanyl-tRNA--protein transferase [Pseudomonadota bacterium]
MFDPLDPELVLAAYQQGLFPMARSCNQPELVWLQPIRRAIMPMGGLHIPRRLQKTMRSSAWRVSIDDDFASVIAGCAAPRQAGDTGWINQPILECFCKLHDMGYAHSIEVWYDNALAGGLYGLALGGAFFAESMFHLRSDASKIALVHAVNCLERAGYLLFDCQFRTPHLVRFGVIEVTHPQFCVLLEQAIAVTPARLLRCRNIKHGIKDDHSR